MACQPQAPDERISSAGVFGRIDPEHPEMPRLVRLKSVSPAAQLQPCGMSSKSSYGVSQRGDARPTSWGPRRLPPQLGRGAERRACLTGPSAILADIPTQVSRGL